MDDYSITNLYESRNEFTARLVNILTPHVIEGVRSIFDEAWKLCNDNDEESKYLMTFQNFLSRVPKWNSTIIDQECVRIKERSSCNYIEELIACVHVVQLKSLTCMRVGMKNKKVNVDVPKATDFVHNVYINVARKLYTNVYLFERNVHSLQAQRNRREIEIIVQECVMNAMRDTIPIEKLLKIYMDPTIEEDVEISETTNVISRETLLDTANSSGVDVDVGDALEMPTLAPSKTMATKSVSSGDFSGSLDPDAEIVSVMEAREMETLKTAEAKEIELMRAVLSDAATESSDDSSRSSKTGVTFNDDVSVKTDEHIGDNGENSTFHEAADDDGYETDSLHIGESVNMDLGIESVGGGGGGDSILGDIEVLS
jgi:hypothetical protein